MPFSTLPSSATQYGMFVRLAFAVVARIRELELLIVDEVLAVGDAAFQCKCLGKMQSLSEGGQDRTIR